MGFWVVPQGGRNTTTAHLQTNQFLGRSGVGGPGSTTNYTYKADNAASMRAALKNAARQANSFLISGGHGGEIDLAALSKKWIG